MNWMPSQRAIKKSTDIHKRNACNISAFLYVCIFPAFMTFYFVLFAPMSALICPAFFVREPSTYRLIGKKYSIWYFDSTSF